MKKRRTGAGKLSRKLLTILLLSLVMLSCEKQTPSQQIAVGSVAIAGKQTGIYPSNSPGGWHVIGRTPINMFDKKRTPACYLQAGDMVQFKPITKKEFEQFL